MIDFQKTVYISLILWYNHNVKKSRKGDGYMIDHIIGWDGKYPIYSSDINPYSNYIGYEDEKGEIHLYE